VLAAVNDAITNALSHWGYAAVFVLMMLESACVPIPSEVTMLFAGALTSTAFAGSGNGLTLPGVVVAGVVGNLVGSWLAYWAGAAGGRPFADRYGRYLLIHPHEVERAHAWFARRGDVTVFVARLVPVARTFISLPAGVARMRFGRFTFYTLLGCIPFVTVLAYAGHVAGANWTKIQHLLAPVSYAIVAGIIVIVIVYVARRWTKVRAEYAALDATRAAEE
jgi:membrane protein DedA with SNARE-associated domain